MLPLPGWDNKFSVFYVTLCPFFTSLCKDVDDNLLQLLQQVSHLMWSWFALQDSLYQLPQLFFSLTLGLRHASPLGLLTSPVGCLPTNSNLVSSMLCCFFFTLESPALCKASSSLRTRPRLLLSGLPRICVCLKTTNCEAAPREQVWSWIASSSPTFSNQCLWKAS